VTRPLKVSFELKHDVKALDGRRYILVKVLVHEPAHPKSGLWGDHEISVWVPFRKGATVDSVRAGGAQGSAQTLSRVREYGKVRNRFARLGVIMLLSCRAQ